MIVTCHECNTSFNLDEGLVKPTGSKVRCSKCKSIFTVYPSAKPEETERPTEPLPESPRHEESDAASHGAHDEETENVFGDYEQPEPDSQEAQIDELDLDSDMGFTTKSEDDFDLSELGLDDEGASVDTDELEMEPDLSIEEEAEPGLNLETDDGVVAESEADEDEIGEIDLDFNLISDATEDMPAEKQPLVSDARKEDSEELQLDLEQGIDEDMEIDASDIEFENQ